MLHRDPVVILSNYIPYEYIFLKKTSKTVLYSKVTREVGLMRFKLCPPTLLKLFLHSCLNSVKKVKNNMNKILKWSKSDTMSVTLTKHNWYGASSDL